MFCFEFEGKRPTVHPEAFVAPTATLIGDATVEKGANVQDNSVLHAAPGETLPAGMVVTGSPAKPAKPIGGTSSERWIEQNPPYYQDLAQRHRAGAAAVEAAVEEVS